MRTISSPSSTSIDHKLRRHIQARDWQAANALVSSLPAATPDQLNARAVCLMRLGRFDQAVRLLQGLVLSPNCTWLRTETPVVFRTNFATALLLAGNSVGVRDVLSEIDEKDHPSHVRLAAAVTQWESGLTPWQRFCWRIGFPPARPMTIDFEPGDFTWDQPAGLTPDRSRTTQEAAATANAA